MRTINDTIDNLQDELLFLNALEGESILEFDLKNLIITIRDALYHLEEIRKTHGNGGNCDFIVTMDKDRFRHFAKTMGKPYKF